VFIVQLINLLLSSKYVNAYKAATSCYQNAAKGFANKPIINLFFKMQGLGLKTIIEGSTVQPILNDML